MKKINSFLVLFLCASCVPALEDQRVAPGDPVRFSPVVEGDDADTRTVYSGAKYDVGTSTYERVDWVVGDCILIASEQSPEKVADYSVSGVSGNTDRKSSAQIRPSGPSGHGLTWGENAHDFYAIYPAPGSSGASDRLSYDRQNSSATLYIPDRQVLDTDDSNPDHIKMRPDMNYAYMYAAKRVDSPAAQVDLQFRPLFTAFEIIVGSDETEELALYRFHMTATQKLNGTYPVTLNTANNGSWTLGTVSNDEGVDPCRIDVSLGGEESPTVVKQGKSLTFTVFAVPQAVLSGVVLHFETNKGNRTLELKYADNRPMEFTAGHKVIIEALGIPGTVRTYTVEPIADLEFWGAGANSGRFTVQSYSETPAQGRRNEQWKIEYSTDNNDWYDSPADAGASWLTVSGTTPHNGTETLTVDIAAQSTPSSSSIGEIQEIHELILQGADPVSDYDLSMHTIHGELRSTPVTANCYVVKAPGTYLFPLVYGNAIDGTKSDVVTVDGVEYVNQEAYQPSRIPANALNALKRFFNADNRPIGSPFIESDPNIAVQAERRLDAIVLWQDGTLYNSAEGVITPIITVAPEVVAAPANSPLSGKCRYIRFTIDSQKIRQGNIVIALRDITGGSSASQAKILWSWHIWVTDEDLHPQEVEMLEGSVQMMPVNVGYIDIQGTVKKSEYAERACYLRITQIDSEGNPLAGGKSKIFRVDQHKGINYKVYEGGETIEDYSTPAKTYLGSSPYYQFGRKDPFLGRDYSNGLVNIKYTAPQDYRIVHTSGSDYTVNYVSNLSNSSNSGVVDLSLSIKNPHIFYYSTNSSHYWYSGYQMADPLYVQNFSITEGFNNLWNAYSAGQGNDTRIRKTVYDPCPPGFSMPPRNAFSAFTKDGGLKHYGTTSEKAQINGDFDDARDGYHFYKKRMTTSGEKDPSGGTIFFCRTGLRRHASLRDSYTDWGAYWTAERSKVTSSNYSDRAIHLVINHSKNVEPRYHETAGGYLTDSWSIRPTEEEAW